MALLHRSRLMQANILVKEYLTQDSLAKDLQQVLRISEKVELASLVSRFVNGETENSRLFDAIHLIFWHRIVLGGYPLLFVKWLEQAYAAYDADSISKNGGYAVRALIAEPSNYWPKPDKKGAPPPEAGIYPRFEAARQLMLGIAIGVEQKVLGASNERMKEGVKHLLEAVRLFATLPAGEFELSTSDKFHMALALHMADWLLTEYASDGERKDALEQFSNLSAVGAFAWVADQTESWVFQYNVTEVYGALNRAQDAKKCFVKAINLNPRLAAFAIKTPNDGLDEESLSEAPALRNMLMEIEREKADWLAIRKAAYERHADDYDKNTSKGIRAMLKTVRELEIAAKAQRTRPVAKVFGLVLLGLVCAGAMLGFDARAARAKPIFISQIEHRTLLASKPIFGTNLA